MPATQKIKFAAVILDNAIDKFLDYEIPDELLALAKPGVRVLVPVRGSLRKGTIFSLKEKADFPRVKKIEKLDSEEPLVSSDLFLLPAGCPAIIAPLCEKR